MKASKSNDLAIPVLDVIQQRRSRRAYADKAVEPEKIKLLFEAARWAPSSVNEQPWTYLYATREQEELWSRILNTLADGNKIWAKDAPLLVMSMARKYFSRNGRPNHSAKYDLGSANGFLSLQATALGLNVHQMAGFDGEKARVDLNVPDEYELGVIMAIGYPGDPDQLPENLKARELAPRQRTDIEQFVFNKSF
ncbi:MAG: nitroreductase family protein [Cyclobacteriaceae bacterium]